MERLTKNKNISEMSTFELALNCLYAKDGQAIYRNFSDTNINVRRMLRNLYKHYTGEDTPKDDTDFDELMYDDLQFDIKNINGLLAFLYMNLWSKTELYERLKYYEDLEEQGLLLKLPCKVGDIIYQVWYKPCHYGNTYPDSYECCGCEDECDLRREIQEFVVPSVEWTVCNMKDFGDSVYFLTREEAERKLKELEGK